MTVGNSDSSAYAWLGGAERRVFAVQAAIEESVANIAEA